MRRVLVGVVLVVAGAPTVVRGDAPPKIQPAPTPPAVVGLTELARFAPPTGFVDDPIAMDADRLAYVVSDGAAATRVHLVELATGKETGSFDLAPLTARPKWLAWIGKRLLIGFGDPGAMTAALVDAGGKVVYRTPAATRVAVVERGGAPRLVLYRSVPGRAGTRHSVELRAPDTGKRVGKVGTLDVDAAGASAKLDFRVNHWTAGMTRAVGMRGGTWNKREDQRSPDVEATYDVVDGKVVATAAITDVVEQRRRYALLAEVAAGADVPDAFARAAPDLSGIELWRDGKRTPLELDQPLLAYGDPRTSLAYAPGPGGAWIALQIDPVNVDAVKRQKADAEYWDLFEVQGSKALRRARKLATRQRLRFGWAGDRLWVLERNVGFDRGGKALVVYKLGS